MTQIRHWSLPPDSSWDNSAFLCNSLFNFAMSSCAKRNSYSQIANFSSSASFSSSKLCGSATVSKISRRRVSIKHEVMIKYVAEKTLFQGQKRLNHISRAANSRVGFSCFWGWAIFINRISITISWTAGLLSGCDLSGSYHNSNTEFQPDSFSNR